MTMEFFLSMLVVYEVGVIVGLLIGQQIQVLMEEN